MLEHVSHDIILELCELARNMSWPNGLVLIWLGWGFKPWWTQICFLFAKKLVWHGYERVETTLAGALRDFCVGQEEEL